MGSSVQFSPTVVSNSLQPHGLQHAMFPCASPPGAYSNISIALVMPSNHLILCCPLLLLLPIPLRIRVFSTESIFCMRYSKNCIFSFSIISSNEHPGLVSFRMEWLDLFAVQGTLKSLLQYQLKIINSLALSFLHSPTLTSMHDHWRNHVSE